MFGLASSSHTAEEHVAVKVALGVLLLLFVLNLIEPTLKNIAPLRGLRFCDKLVTGTFSRKAMKETTGTWVC